MKNLIGYLTIFIIRLFSWMPLGMARAFGCLLARIVWRTSDSFRHVADVNTRLCFPQLPDSERNRLMRKAFINNAMMFTEMGLMWGRPAKDSLAHINQIHGEEIFDAAITEGKGVLLLVPHLGNWELTNTYIASRSDLTAMYRPARNPVFDEWMHSRREATGGELVPTTTGGIKALYRALRNGGVVGVLPDQEPRPEGGEFAPFLGTQALTPTLPVQLLKRTGARAVFLFARRLEDQAKFDLHFVEPDEEIYAADTSVALAAMNRTVER